MYTCFQKQQTSFFGKHINQAILFIRVGICYFDFINDTIRVSSCKFYRCPTLVIRDFTILTRLAASPLLLNNVISSSQDFQLRLFSYSQ